MFVDGRLECGRWSLPVLKAHPRDDVLGQRCLDLDELTVREHHDAPGLVSVLGAVGVAYCRPRQMRRVAMNASGGKTKNAARNVQVVAYRLMSYFSDEMSLPPASKHDAEFGQHRDAERGASGPVARPVADVVDRVVARDPCFEERIERHRGEQRRRGSRRRESGRSS